MILNDIQKSMLDGNMGYPAQLGMQINMALADAFDAERLVPITGAHMGAVSLRSAESAITQFWHDMADQGGKFKVFTTTNIISGDLENWEKLGLRPEDKAAQQSVIDALTKMGATILNTCTPYNVGNVPRLGEQVAWMESSAIIYANSVLGARTNREGMPSAMSAAVTGYAPEFGLRLKENRYANIVVHVKCSLDDNYEYGTLGYFAGKDAARKGIVVFDGIDYASNDNLKFLGAAMATSGCTGIYHVAGITPEAPTLETALNGKAPILEYEFGEKEKKEIEEFLNRDKSTDVDWVQIGCPHASIKEIEQMAKALDGKKLHPAVTMWVNSSAPVIKLAQRLGYAEMLEKAGAILVADTCAINLLLPSIDAYHHRNVCTNSAKQCHYIPGMTNGLTTHYGSIEKLAEAAVSGEWR